MNLLYGHSDKHVLIYEYADFEKWRLEFTGACPLPSCRSFCYRLGNSQGQDRVHLPKNWVAV